MKKGISLTPGTGMLAQIGLRDELLRYLGPDERLVVAPVRWLTPPWSLSFPSRNTETQHEFLAAVTDMGLHTWTYQWSGERYAILEHNLWRYNQMSAFEAKTAQRALGGWRRRTEEVVLLQVGDRTDGRLACESRFHAAIDQVKAIQESIKA